MVPSATDQLASFYAAIPTPYERELSAIRRIEEALEAGRASVDLGYGRVIRGRRNMRESLAARRRALD